MSKYLFDKHARSCFRLPATHMHSIQRLVVKLWILFFFSIMATAGNKFTLIYVVVTIIAFACNVSVTLFPLHRITVYRKCLRVKIICTRRNDAHLSYKVELFELHIISLNYENHRKKMEYKTKNPALTNVLRVNKMTPFFVWAFPNLKNSAFDWRYVCHTKS